MNKCSYFYDLNGWCKNGESCKYYHKLDDIEVNLNNEHINIKKAKQCEHLLRNGVCNGGVNNVACKFKHVGENIKKKGTYYWDKSFECTQFLENKICKFGKKCMHYHKGGIIYGKIWISENEMIQNNIIQKLMEENKKLSEDMDELFKQFIESNEIYQRLLYEKDQKLNELMKLIK